MDWEHFKKSYCAIVFSASHFSYCGDAEKSLIFWHLLVYGIWKKGSRNPCCNFQLKNNPSQKSSPVNQKILQMCTF